MSRELGDLGRTVSLRPARRRHPLLVLLVAVLVLGGVTAWASAGADVPAGDPPDAAGTGEVEAAAAHHAPDRAVATTAARAGVGLVGVPVLGRVGDLHLHVPAVDPVLVSYHEASLPEALPMTALGELSRNDNPTRRLVAEPHVAGLPFHVQVSRGRANSPTSAVDVVLAPGDPVRAPVAGTVTDVRPYQLYGAHDDVRLELHPDGHDLRVVLIHLQDVTVAAGDRVEVGQVIAGGARSFPFAAVVDRETEPERYGHVHLEVKAPD